MPVLKKNEFTHPLTDKWLPLIHRFAFRYKKPLLDMIQESYILEWKIQQSKKKFDSDQHRDNYFKKALYRNLYRKASDWGVFERESLNSFLHRRSAKGQRLLENEHELEKPKMEFFFCSDNSLDLIGTIIEMRPFDEIYFNDLVNHAASILAEKSVLAKQIFLDRMNMQITWKELRLKQYKQTSQRKFSDAVELIRKVVRKELCSA